MEKVKTENRGTDGAAGGGIGEEKLIATAGLMLWLENAMCCVLWELRGILHAVVLRLEIGQPAGTGGVGRSFGAAGRSFALRMRPCPSQAVSAPRQSGDA
jgi:hypothetical protein